MIKFGVMNSKILMDLVDSSVYHLKNQKYVDIRSFYMKYKSGLTKIYSGKGKCFDPSVEHNKRQYEERIVDELTNYYKGRTEHYKLCQIHKFYLRKLYSLYFRLTYRGNYTYVFKSYLRFLIVCLLRTVTIVTRIAIFFAL